MYVKEIDGQIFAVASDSMDSDYVYTDREIVRGYDGGLYYIEDTETKDYREAEAQYLLDKELESLRSKRAEECFSIINRGKLWYDKLTPTQITELSEWYTLWLDVTATLTVPSKPEWL